MATESIALTQRGLLKHRSNPWRDMAYSTQLMYTHTHVTRNKLRDLALASHGTSTQLTLRKLLTANKYAAVCETTRCMAMPSLMAARWVGQNSGPIFMDQSTPNYIRLPARECP